ncbi:hypothetical protein T439DRAFT_328795 [Meredithblackwellia eburnea MCA 4105]
MTRKSQSGASPRGKPSPSVLGIKSAFSISGKRETPSSSPPSTSRTLRPSSNALALTKRKIPPPPTSRRRGESRRRGPRQGEREN